MLKKKLGKDFYLRPDVVEISRELIGKYLFTNVNGIFTGGIIVETEAYSGRNDRACHAHLNRRTRRTEVMYKDGGLAYVYLCYGIHYLFNIITNVEGLADAVLVRAIEPVEGIDHMKERRIFFKNDPALSAGPGVVSKALGINKNHYGQSLLGEIIWVEDRGYKVDDEMIQASPRVGVAYAGEDALLPWRFRLKNNRWTSKAK
ncbi:DNA-3-methyladenine glycosylase [soil metagenome]|jgi:DNA-3-methyladenine glycosylase